MTITTMMIKNIIINIIGIQDMILSIREPMTQGTIQNMIVLTGKTTIQERI